MKLKPIAMIWLALVMLLLVADFSVWIAAHPDGPGVAASLFIQIMVARLTRSWWPWNRNRSSRPE